MHTTLKPKREDWVIAMGDAKLHWDDDLKRWRGMYRGKRLSRSAKKLGGTNATDTKVKANQWLKKRKAEIDAELGEKTRRHEAEYRAELESLQAARQGLMAIRQDPIASPVLQRIEKNVKEIERRLQSRSLPPLEESLRNPLNFSVKEIEENAKQQALEALFPPQIEEIHQIVSFIEHVDEHPEELYNTFPNHELKVQLGMFICHVYPYLTVDLQFDMGVVDRMFPETPDMGQWRSRIIKTIIALEKWIKINRVLSLKDATIPVFKEKIIKHVGAVPDEFERGMLCQKINGGNLIVSEEKNLFIHLDKFIAFHEARMESRELIVGGHLGQIVLQINTYRNWVQGTGTNDIDVVSTKQHADAYFEYLLEKKKKGEMVAETVRKYFSTFKSFISYLAEEEVLDTIPTWLTRKSGRHTVRGKKKEAEPIPVTDMRRIYDEAGPTVRLFMLLILNCGVGQGEIGRMLREKYDPATGIIEHRRLKTGRNPNTPTVYYRLWGRTKKLLDQQLEFQNEYPRVPGNEYLLLLNTKGKPLWEEWYVDGKSHKNDCIAPMFETVVKRIRRRDKDFPSYSFYRLRSTSASAIFNNKEFRSLDWLWLGHAPNTMAGQHYNKLDTTILDECLAWLETHLFENGIDH